MDLLNSAEAATYLRLGERKLYELVASGSIPCSKVTGRWVFPRDALDRWVLAGLSRPAGVRLADPPAIVGGSQDDLLAWCLRQSGSGLASLTEGTAQGMVRLLDGGVAVAAIHFHGDDEDANLAAIRAMPAFHDALVVGFAKREQGLVLPAGNPAAIADFDGVLGRGLRIAVRQPGAGARMLFDRLLAERGRTAADASRLDPPCLTGPDVALAVRDGAAGCGIATRAVAQAAGLDFLPIVWERFDLAMRQRTFFSPPVQALMRYLRSGKATARADALGGYDLSPAGTVRYFA